MYSLTWGHHFGPGGWRPGSGGSSSSRRRDTCKRRSAGDAAARKGSYLERVQVGEFQAAITPTQLGTACTCDLTHCCCPWGCAAGLARTHESSHDIWNHVSSWGSTSTVPNGAASQGMPAAADSAPASLNVQTHYFVATPAQQMLGQVWPL
jgi:hypothetical protein